MSGYDVDTRISFVTLAVGEEFVERAMTLVQSVLKFTSSDIYLVTDCAELGEKHRNYFGSRLNIVDITNYPNFVRTIHGKFNYHLKALVIDHISRLTSNVMIYVDADTFLFGWDKSISRYILGFDNCLMARCRETVADNTSLKRFIPAKAEQYGIDHTTIHVPLAVETVMVITRGDLTKRFIQKWSEISVQAIEKEFDPFIEAFELALAIQETQMNIVNVNNRTPFADSFRTLHNGKLISTNII
jgi:hypothetical protein